MTMFFVGISRSEREKKSCADKQWLLSCAVFCLHKLHRSGSQQLQEAFIMSLARGGKSQYSKNKNGFETWGGLRIMYNGAKHKWDVRLAVSCCLHVYLFVFHGDTRFISSSVSPYCPAFIDMQVSEEPEPNMHYWHLQGCYKNNK